MVLAKGDAHVELMPHDWALTGGGLAAFVQRLPGIMRRMLGITARVPKIVFTDRGTGMYTPQGFIVRDYEFALSDVGLQPFWGADATPQAPDMPDVLLHETAVGMFRNLLRKEKPAVEPWKRVSAAMAAAR